MHDALQHVAIDCARLIEPHKEQKSPLADIESTQRAATPKGVTMLNYKQNGDVHLGPVRVWNQFRQSPPRWLMFVYAAGTMATGWLAVNGLHILLDSTL